MFQSKKYQLARKITKKNTHTQEKWLKVYFQSCFLGNVRKQS